MTNEMSLSFSATLENEPFVRTCIASFVVCLNPTVDEIVEIKTVVGEAVSNAIIHGYNGDKGCLVKVKAYIEDDLLTIYVIDKGQGIQDIEKARQPMFTSKKELQKENDDLKEQVASLEERLNRTALEQSELEKLRKLYDMDQSYDTYEKAAANVVGKDASNWFDTFIIDKGSNAGIEIGNNVIADGGLVGIVTDVGSNYAKVRSIIDDASNVSATDVATSDNCIISGSLKSMNERQQLEITDLKDSDDQVKAGDQIVTSNISDRYLPGIPIGYITDITQDSSSLTKTGYLATIVDFEHLDKVLVIKQVKDYSEAN